MPRFKYDARSRRSPCASALFLVAMAALGYSVPRAALAQDGILLAPKYDKNRTVYIEQHTNTIRSMQREADGPVSTVKSESLYGMLATVVETDGKGAALVRFTIDRVRFSDETLSKSPIDTDAGLGESASGAAAVAKAMVGRSVELRMAADRCEPNADQIVALQTAMSQAIGSDPRLMHLLDEFSLERFRYSWGDARLALYPSKTVNINETWERALRQTMPDGNETLYHYKCRLASSEMRGGRKFATIAFSGDIRQNADTALKKSASQDLQMTLKSGNFSGTAVFDVERGELSSQDTAAKLEVEVRAVDANGQSRQMLLRQVIESNTTIRPAEARKPK